MTPYEEAVAAIGDAALAEIIASYRPHRNG